MQGFFSAESGHRSGRIKYDHFCRIIGADLVTIYKRNCATVNVEWWQNGMVEKREPGNSKLDEV